MNRYLSITPLSSNELILTALINPGAEILARRVTFESTGMTHHKWGFTVTTGTQNSQHSVVYVNDDQDKSFFLLSVDTKKLFLSVNTSDGTVLSKHIMGSS